MKNRIYIIYVINLLLITYPLVLSAQQDSGFTNKAEAKNLMVNGKKEGKWLEYGDTNLKSTETERTLKGDGYQIIRTETTTISGPYYSLIIYKKGVPYGKVRGYYKSGTLYSEGQYNNGVQKVYYESGIIKQIDTVLNGILEGIERVYSTWGQPQLEVPWHDGKINGTEKNFNRDGSLSNETPYENGEINGPQKWYDEKGRLSEEVPWSDNKTLNGIEKNYDENGKVTHETPYVNDTINGSEKLYDNDYNLHIETIYAKGIRTMEKYYLQGKLKWIMYYENGVGVRTVHYDENGNEIK